MQSFHRRHHKSHLLKYSKIILSRLDFIQLFAMFALLLIGVLFIYSTGEQNLSLATKNLWTRQIKWIILGSIAWGGLTILDYRKLKQFAVIIFIVSVIGLLLVYLPSEGNVAKGARRWIEITKTFKIQPSEFAKFAVILLGAWILSLQEFNINKVKHLSLFCLIMSIPFTLILIQPDLGSALVLVPIVVLLLFTAKIKWKFIFAAVLISSIILPLSYNYVLKEYQRDRWKVYREPDKDLSGIGWHQRQSEIAVGSGGMYGKGFGKGKQNTLGFLSESHTDFIFSVIAEETGFLGSCILITLYNILLLSALRTAIVARDAFGQYLAIGISSLLFFHSFINIGMCIRIAPVTGLPLPLVSYGGSFIVITMTYLGLLQSIYTHRKT